MFKLYDQFYTSHHNSIKTPDSSTSFNWKGRSATKMLPPSDQQPNLAKSAIDINLRYPANKQRQTTFMYTSAFFNMHHRWLGGMYFI